MIKSMKNCIFCKIVNGEAPSMRVYEDEFTLAFMDIAADVDGHICVIPKVHCESILDCEGETLSKLMNTVKKISEHLTQNCGYGGVNLLNASGKAADQSVLHFHIHIIPRKENDGLNTWPKFPGAKEDIKTVFERIKMI